MTTLRSFSHAALQGGLTLVAGQTLSRLLGFASLLVLARFLMPADFGLVAIASGFVLLLEATTGVPVSDAIIQKQEDRATDYQTAFTLSMIRGVILALITVAAARPLGWAYGDERLAAITSLLAASPLLRSAMSPYGARYARRLSYGREVLINLVATLLSSAAAIIIVVVSHSYWAIVFKDVGLALCLALLSYVVFPGRLAFTLTSGRELLSFSIWLTLGRLVTAAGFRSDMLVVGRLFGPSITGELSVGQQLGRRLLDAPLGPGTRALFSAFCRFSNDRARLATAFQRAQALLVAYGVPIGVGMSILAAPVVGVVLGEPWQGAVPIVQVVGLNFALRVIVYPVEALAMSVGRTRLIFLRHLIVAGLRLPVLLGAAIFFSFQGFLIAVFCVRIIATIVDAVLVRELVGLGLIDQILNLVRTVLATAIMGGVLLLSGATTAEVGPTWSALVSLCAHAGLGAAAFGAGHFLFWLAAGRPAGAESEVLRLTRTVAARLWPARPPDGQGKPRTRDSSAS